MARTTQPLTNTEVRQAKPKDKEFNLVDGNGLALRVKPNGSKLWIFNFYQPHTKKRISISFGIFPEVSLADARQKRFAARELLAKEIDPKEHREQVSQKQAETHANTLEHVAAQWFEVKKSQVSADYAKDIWRSLDLHIFPRLGKLPIHKISAPNTIGVIKPIASKGSLETVKRLCQRLNEIMIQAVNTGLLQANPLAGISKAFQTPQKRNLPALKPDELPELLNAMAKTNIKIITRCLIEWQLHTMTRPSEAAGARWEEIDIDNALWSIPAQRMKKKRPHSIPITPKAMALLEEMRPISGHREYVFTGDRDYSKQINNQTANAALKRMGFGGRTVAHGLRSLASTTLNEQGFDPDIIEAALAHVDSNEVRRAYNRAEYLERRRVMMGWWSEHIVQAATGNIRSSANMKSLRAVN
jgi:integrase